MKFSTSYSSIFVTYATLLRHGAKGEECTFQDTLPINAEDFDQPDWAAIIETAFPSWEVPAAGCPRLDKIGGALEEGFDTFPTPEVGKFNPCYYTKAFAGLDPMLGGYPTPIDTKYPYEFAAPFFGQPGDGSTHHCLMDAAPETKIQSCPKAAKKCADGAKDCNTITDEFGIGHVPPFVPLAAVKNAFTGCQEDVCSWFDDIDECNIPKSVLDRLVHSTFGVDGTIKFTPPKILDDLPASDPKSTYYKLEYLGDPVACADDNCRGPHYCSVAAAVEDIWGDFCPYIHTSENSGLYRHPHVALAAFELWIANKCKPEKCPSTWLDSPNGKDYGLDKMTSTSITWAEMDDNNDRMAQPIVPYKWPNSGDGLYPGKELYGDLMIKPAAGSYVTKFVAKGSTAKKEDKKVEEKAKDKSGGAHMNGSMTIASSLALVIAVISCIA